MLVGATRRIKVHCKRLWDEVVNKKAEKNVFDALSLDRCLALCRKSSINLWQSEASHEIR